MIPKIRIVPEFNPGELKIHVYQTEMLAHEANMAMVLLEKWGPVCATDDGEDSTGRMKTRPLTPEETVRRAFDIAAIAVSTARERGLIIQIPDLNEINAENDSKNAAKR